MQIARCVRLTALAVAAAVALIADSSISRPPAESSTSSDISTDRPDFTESTDVVGPGVMQLEGGLLLSRHALGAESAHGLLGPSPLLRIGVSRRVELRLSTDGLATESILGARGDLREHHAGISDVEIGAKLQLWDERELRPAFAVIGALSIPTGSYFSSSGRDPLAVLCWSKSLPGGFDAGGNVNFRWLAAGSQAEKDVSLTVGRKLGRGFGAFVEIYRLAPIDNDEAAHAIADIGITKLVGHNTQFDIEIGHTTNARTPYWFVGAGFAIRVSKPTLLTHLLRH